MRRRVLLSGVSATLALAAGCVSDTPLGDSDEGSDVGQGDSNKSDTNLEENSSTDEDTTEIEESEPSTEEQTESEPQSESESEDDENDSSEERTETDSDSEADTEPETEAESQSEDSDTETETETETESDAEADAESQSESNEDGDEVESQDEDMSDSENQDEHEAQSEEANSNDESASDELSAKDVTGSVSAPAVQGTIDILDHRFKWKRPGESCEVTMTAENTTDDMIYMVEMFVTLDGRNAPYTTPSESHYEIGPGETVSRAITSEDCAGVESYEIQVSPLDVQQVQQSSETPSTNSSRGRSGVTDDQVKGTDNQSDDSSIFS